jgi:methylglyoxal synthase
VAELEAVAIGAAPDPALDPAFDLANEAIALIAHDAMKPRMLALAEQHFELLDKFAMRYATGTTGGLLNQLARRVKGEAAGSNWVTPFLSGPLGGDAQIAELILTRQCSRVLFLEDPHVARQHEADIQLLERAARTVTNHASCSSDEWCAALVKVAGPARGLTYSRVVGPWGLKCPLKFCAGHYIFALRRCAFRPYCPKTAHIVHSHCERKTPAPRAGMALSPT